MKKSYPTRRKFLNGLGAVTALSFFKVLSNESLLDLRFKNLNKPNRIGLDDPSKRIYWGNGPARGSQHGSLSLATVPNN
jgi:hypothetical protein